MGAPESLSQSLRGDRRSGSDQRDERARPSEVQPGPVLALAGAGALGFSGMELETLVRLDLPVVAVVGNNGIWGLEKHPMRALYGYDVAADLQPELRYDQMMDAFGGRGEFATDPDGIARRSSEPLPRRADARQRRDRSHRRLPKVVQPRLSYPTITAFVAVGQVEKFLRCGLGGWARASTSDDSGRRLTQ